MANTPAAADITQLIATAYSDTHVARSPKDDYRAAATDAANSIDAALAAATEYTLAHTPPEVAVGFFSTIAAIAAADNNLRAVITHLTVARFDAQTAASEDGDYLAAAERAYARVNSARHAFRDHTRNLPAAPAAAIQERPVPEAHDSNVLTLTRGEGWIGTYALTAEFMLRDVLASTGKPVSATITAEDTGTATTKTVTAVTDGRIECDDESCYDLDSVTSIIVH